MLALPVEDFYFTLADVDRSVLDFAVRDMLKTIKTPENGIVGGPGSGKTPSARIVALCASRYWKRELHLDTPASVREASEFDFFRGQPGRKDRPDIHDDGCLAAEPIRKMKGFADVGCTMLTKECWGAAKFVQGQMRIFVCSDFAFTRELEKAQDLHTGLVFHVKHQDFLDVIAPMFPLGTEPPHIMAVLKRANIVINAGKVLLFHSATQDKVSVPSMAMVGPADFLKPEPAIRYMTYRDNKILKPPTFQEDLKWEATYLEAPPSTTPLHIVRFMKKHRSPRAAQDLVGRSSFKSTYNVFAHAKSCRNQAGAPVVSQSALRAPNRLSTFAPRPRR